MKALRIPNWSRYMPADAKKCTVMQWVAVPITHDGLGYIEIMSHPDGIRMIGGWLLILQTAARCPVRGLLVSDSGRILRAREIALKTRASESDISACIVALLANGWIEEIEEEEAIRTVSGQHPDAIRTTGQDRTGQERRGQASGRHPDDAPAPSVKNGKLIKHLMAMGLPSQDRAVEEWKALLLGRLGASTADEAIDFVTFAVESGKRDGVNVQYPKHAAVYIDAWRARA